MSEGRLEKPRDSLRNVKILVTGASGFIGRSLCRSLIHKGAAVRGCSRNEPHGEWSDGMEWVGCDIGEDVAWAPLLKDAKYAVHLAGLAHQIGSRAKGREDEFRRINTEATRLLAEAAARSPCLKRVIFISSVAAVTPAADDVVTERTACAPQDDYGKSKLLAEEALRQVLCSGLPDWCILRPTLVYGPGNPGNMARLLKLIRLGIPLPLAGISNRRSFLFVGNLIDAIEFCLGHPKASRKPFLVSDSEVVSTVQLIRRLAELSRRNVRLFSLPLGILRAAGLIGDLLGKISGRSVGLDSYSVARLSNSLAVDTTGLRSEVGWSPAFTLTEGLAKTLAPLDIN